MKEGKVLVLGKGASGQAAAKLLEQSGYTVDFADGYDFVVTSPGIQVKSELQVGCEALKAKGVKLLAVTGSKGKSSVVKLVADALNANGKSAIACGNYGVPVSEVVGLTEVNPCQWAVVEVSSFQLETTYLKPDTFEGAVILNLQEDHLDRHGSVEVYHGLKKKLLTFAKRNEIDWPCRGGEVERLISGYFDNEILRSNAEKAIWLMRVAGLSDEAIAKAFRDFEPLPHRMNLVGEFGGVKCIDDSKATSIAALIAGISMVGGPVRLIAGGLDKGDDPKSALNILTKWVKKVYIIGKCAEKFAEAWSGTVECEISGTMEVAVKNAMRDAEKGETILLSPGTASFDQFKSFGERGEVFARLVQQEGQK